MSEREPLRVLSHLPPRALERVTARVPDLPLLHVPMEGEPPPDARGNVLLTFARGAPNLARVLEHGGVRWIHTIGTGVDHFPLELVGGRLLTCSRGASAVPIAEWVLAMLLAFAKRLPGAWVHAPPERWSLRELGGLAGHVLGLVGIGGIGSAVAKRALAFEMRVRALRRRKLWSPVPGVELAASLEDLLASADHLVLAVPATDATQHLIGRAALAHAKPGLHLVNVARGSLVDQDALREALDDGRVARASLDVCDPEPLPAGHWLYSHEKVHLSPHVSWAGPGAFEALLDSFIANVDLWRRGLPLEGVVDLEAGY
jgi:phosphoglycerate dehydrogenase-like enzyme